jgi:hypothetical protein
VYFQYRPDTTNSFFGEFVSPAGGRRKKIRVIHSVPDLGGFGVSFARNSFHPAARNETLFEAASLQAGLQGHCWVEQLHGDGSWSGSATPTPATLPCLESCNHPALNRPLVVAPTKTLHPHPPIAAPPCSGLLQGPMLSTLPPCRSRWPPVAARAP